MNYIVATHFSSSVSKRGEPAAKAHMAVGTGHDPLLVFADPFDVVELDAYEIEAFFSVSFKTQEGVSVKVALERIWLLALIERISTSVLGYSVIYRPQVSSEDVLKLIRDTIQRPWTPKPLSIEGLEYPRNGGLPSGVIPECRNAVWSALFVDNALANMGNDIAQLARKDVGNIINWGPVRHFERRPNIERLFKQIADNVFKRLPSATGAHPKSGRAPDAQEQAVKYDINPDDADQVLDVTIALHNGTPTEGLSFLSPLEYLSQFFESHRDHFLVRQLPTSHEHSGLLNRKYIGTIRGSISHGRRPYLQFKRARYTSPALSEAAALIGKRVTYEIIDDEDIRQLRLYLPNGAELGVVRATGKWAKTKHSLRTRESIIGLINRRVLVLSEIEDPVEAWMAHLSTPTSKTKTITPRNATAAEQLSRETDIPLTFHPQKPGDNNRPHSAPPVGEAGKHQLHIMKPTAIDFDRVINKSSKVIPSKDGDDE